MVLLGGALCPRIGAQETLATNFAPLDTSQWVLAGADVHVRDGKLVIASGKGNQYLTTRKRFLYATLEMSVRFGELSRDSTAFYYLGFQSLTPWADSLCWLMVQDTVVAAIVKKGGQKAFRKPVGYVKENRDYTIKLEWRPTGVKAWLDDRPVLSTDDLKIGLPSASTAGDVIPNIPLPLFLGAYSTAPDRTAPKLQINSVRIEYEPVRGERMHVPTEKEKALLSRSMRWDIGDGAEVAMGKGLLRFETPSATCELRLRDGLTWGRLLHKSSDTDLLYKEDNSPVFAVLDGPNLLDSTTFTLESIRPADGKAGPVELEFVNHDEKLVAVLSLSTSHAGAFSVGLSVRNVGDQPRLLQAAFPLLGRICIGDDPEENRYFYPWRTGIEGKADCSLMTEYGGLAWMQVIAAYSPVRGCGVYVYPEDSSGLPKGLVLKKESGSKDDYVRFSEVTLPLESPQRELLELDEGIGLGYYYLRRTLGPGETLTCPATVLHVYEGTWREPLRDYAQWAHTWYRHVPTPQWFKDCYTFIPVHAPGFYSKEKQKYIASENLEGGEHIQQWAYWEDHVEIPREKLEFPLQGMQAGDFEYHNARGGLKAFREEIQRIQQKDTRHSVYIDHRFCWRETKTAKRHCPAWAAMYKPGDYAYYAKPGDRWVMPFYEKTEWAGYVADVCARLVRDTGMDCIYLDELGIAFPDYNPEKSPLREDGSPVSTRLLAECVTKVRDAMVKEKPDAALMFEHAGSDWLSQFVDGSWAQTFYSVGFGFSEKHYDENSLLYFRFCFPEFKLAEWGESEDGPRRCLFNGVGIDWNNCNQAWNKERRRYNIRAGQVFRECGDAFATPKLEPLVPTLAPNVLANAFPIETKAVYTLYNKGANLVGGPVIDVPARDGCHYVELVHDEPVAHADAPNGRHRLTLRLPANDVVCVAQFPQRIEAHRQGDRVQVSVPALRANERLLAFLRLDDSHLHKHQGHEIKLTDGKGTFSVRDTFGRTGKLILKLFHGYHLADESVLL